MATSETPIKVLLVGTGALGSIYGWRLDVSGKAQVTAVCRSNYEAVKSSGFYISSLAFGDEVYRPHRVVRTVDEAVADGEVYDFVIVCTKALPNLVDNSDIIAPAVQNPHTIIMLIQNGIGIEDPYAARYPNNPIASTIAYLDSSQPSNGTIKHGIVTMLDMGLFSPKTASYDTSAVSARVAALSEVWKESGVPAMVSEDIQKSRWAKLIWNASFNTVSVVSGGNDSRQMLDSPECKALIHSLMTEVIKAGETITGSKLVYLGNQATADDIINTTDGLPKPVTPSMLMDFRAKRPMEHAVILRNPIELAKKHGVDVPHLETVYALLTMVEARYLSQPKL
ncbi:hypothetical protein FBU59_004756 [Linderina macrospora]|uniref:Uncharacterized protein n=1 Tax=Linderina macrospora TaxID=4868 RepID=A0ACC1J4I0_9FUNG|nr:hypothetical protein FBU59_004756 [Linderina macrospora]